MRNVSFALVLAVLNGTAALACNMANPNPMDTTCKPSVFLDRTFGSVTYYMNNGPARFAEIAGCTHPTPLVHENPKWCAAAMQAQRIVTGAR